MKSKKILSITSAIIMCCSLFGCNSNNDMSSEKEKTAVEETTEKTTESPTTEETTERVVQLNKEINFDDSMSYRINVSWNVTEEENMNTIVASNGDIFVIGSSDDGIEYKEDDLIPLTEALKTSGEITDYSILNINEKEFTLVEEFDNYMYTLISNSRIYNATFSKSMDSQLIERILKTIEFNQSNSTEEQAEPTPEEPTEKITLGMKNALSKAKDYLAYSSFSYQGLIDQLEYEKYSAEEATYAVDNCGADWNEQAEKKAKSYIEYSSFSRQGLIDQLVYEGFTEEQAEHGADFVGY